MKWLQLDTDFQDDPKIRALSREWGLEAAAAFWCLLLAYIGKHGGLECRVKIESFGQHSAQDIATKLGCKQKVLLRRLEQAANVHLISPESWEKDMEIFIPNLLKRVDNYTRKVRTKSAPSPEDVPKTPRVDNITSTQQEEIEKLKSRLDSGFEELWAQYPAKDGRKEAEKHFRATVKTDDDLLQIKTALSNYLKHLALTQNNWKRPKAAKTWFNNWKDWVNWVEPAVSQAQGKSAGGSKPDTGWKIERPESGGHPPHHCTVCPSPHDWDCKDPEICGSDIELACPRFFANMQKQKGKTHA